MKKMHKKVIFGQKMPILRDIRHILWCDSPIMQMTLGASTLSSPAQKINYYIPPN